MKSRSKLPTLKSAGADNIRAKSKVRIPLATLATRNMRITRIMRNIGSQGDVGTVGTSVDTLSDVGTAKMTAFTEKNTEKMPDLL